MSWKKRAERAYHHGNLREALIQAARDLIKEKGPGGFTFADAARSAGVSPAAPYRHFRDRDALMADVAREGFERFAAMIDRHWDGIAAYCHPENRVPLGFVEGLNNKIRVIQRRAYGLRDEQYLRLKILTCMLPAL